MTRDYRKSIKFYLGNVFGKWSLTNWIFFVLAVVALGGSGYHIYHVVIGNNSVLASNSTFNKSPIIQGSSNVIVTYVENEPNPDTDIIPSAYTQSLMLAYLGCSSLDTIYNLKNVKVILETGQELFLKNYPCNMQVHAAYTDMYHSSYFIPPKNRIPIDYKECFVLEYDDNGGNTMRIGKDFLDNEECYEKVNGTNNFAAYWAGRNSSSD